MNKEKILHFTIEENKNVLIAKQKNSTIQWIIFVLFVLLGFYTLYQIIFEPHVFSDDTELSFFNNIYILFFWRFTACVTSFLFAFLNFGTLDTIVVDKENREVRISSITCHWLNTKKFLYRFEDIDQVISENVPTQKRFKRIALVLNEGMQVPLYWSFILDTNEQTEKLIDRIEKYMK